MQAGTAGDQDGEKADTHVDDNGDGEDHADDDSGTLADNCPLIRNPLNIRNFGYKELIFIPQFLPRN